MMSALLRPAIALVNRLPFARKFLFVGSCAVLAAAIPLAVLVSHLNGLVSAGEKELRGIEFIQPVNALVQNLQQHRGLSAGLLSGAGELAGKRAARHKEVDAALAAVDPALPSALRDSTEWKAVRSSWEDLSRRGLTFAAADNTAAHTELVGRTLDFMVRIADEYGLTLDSGLDSYYLADAAVLKQPVVLERLARLRALGTAALSKGAIDEASKVGMSVQLAELISAQHQLSRDLDKVAAAQPALAATLREHSLAFAASQDRLIQLITTDILTGRLATASSNYFDLATAVIDSGYQLFGEHLVPALRGSVQARIDARRQAMTLTAGIALAALLACAYLMFAMSAAISKAVGSLHEGSKRLADGDLRARVSIASRDELGDIGTVFNAVADSMQQLIGRVQEGVRDVTAATARLRDASANIRSSTANQSEAASGMAAAVEQMTVGVDEISHSAEAAHRLSRESGELSASGGQIVATVVEEIERISQSVHEAALAIGELGRNSEQISTIVGVIKGIADQTNLLALNAAIEAARAGESGRGFAVVADEVRNLAQRTAQSTSAITDMVATIQRGAQEAVATMENGVGQVTQGVQMAREAGDAMLTICNGTSDVVRVVNEISAALHEQTAAATEISRNVERIAQMSDQNSSAVANNADTAEDLDRLAISLHQAIGRFRV